MMKALVTFSVSPHHFAHLVLVATIVTSFLVHYIHGAPGQDGQIKLQLIAKSEETETVPPAILEEISKKIKNAMEEASDGKDNSDFVIFIPDGPVDKEDIKKLSAESVRIQYPPGDECKDDVKSCCHLAKSGQCEKNILVIPVCRKSCGLCGCKRGDEECLARQRKEHCRLTVDELRKDINSTPSISKLLSIMTPSITKESEGATSPTTEEPKIAPSALVHGLNPEEEERHLPSLFDVDMKPLGKSPVASATVQPSETLLTTPVVLATASPAGVTEIVPPMADELNTPRLVECPGGDCFPEIEETAELPPEPETPFRMLITDKPQATTPMQEMTPEFVTPLLKTKPMIDEEDLFQEVSTESPTSSAMTAAPPPEELRQAVDETEIQTVTDGAGARIGACTDFNETCAFWASMGECEKNPFWMKPHCQKSCNSCNVLVEDVDKIQPHPGCINTHVLCQFWKTLGECEKNPDWMTEFCALSCGTC